MEKSQKKETVKTQIDFAEQHCKSEGVALAAVYLDEGVSGTVPFEERPGGKRLISDAKQGKFNLVYVYKIDRLGRVDLVVHIARHHLESLGVGIRSLTEPFDLSTAHGKFMFSIFASFAQLDRDNIRARTTDGIRRIVRDGKWSGGIVPYGYRVDENKLLTASGDVIPGTAFSEAAVIRKIFKLAVERKSTLAIAEWLNKQRIPTRYTLDGRDLVKDGKKIGVSGKWTAARVAFLLHSTIYKGEHVYGKSVSDESRRISRRVAPLVSEETWQAAQEALRLNTRNAKRKSKRDFLLRSMVRCGLCRRGFAGITIKPEKGEFYYRCYGTFQGTISTCSARLVPAEFLEGLVQYGEEADTATVWVPPSHAGIPDPTGTLEASQFRGIIVKYRFPPILPGEGYY